MSSFPQFSSLPEELQSEILSLNPELILNSSLSSKSIYQLLLNKLKTICHKPASTSELELMQYHNFRSIFTTYEFITDNSMDISIYIKSPNGQLNKISLISTLLTNNITYKMTYRTDFITNSIDDPYSIFYDNVNGVDLLSYYYIMKQRISCNKLIPDYAKIMTRRKLNEMINKFDHGIKRINLYLYLISHKWIFNLDCNDVLPPLSLIGDLQFNLVSPHSNEYQELLDEILILIDLINKNIDKLD